MSMGTTHIAHPLVTGQQIMLPPSLAVTTTFVVREQGQWFEDELRFATGTMVQEGWHVLDIGASYGLCTLLVFQPLQPHVCLCVLMVLRADTLALSAAVGINGHVSSFEPGPDSAAALRQVRQPGSTGLHAFR